MSTTANALRPGDTLYLHGGIYPVAILITASGASSQPIRIASYPGETAIVDGTGRTDYYQVKLSGSYIVLENLEIRNANAGNGVYSFGNYNTLRNLRVHHVWGDGIFISGSANGNVVEECEVWEVSAMHRNVTSGGSYGVGIGAARNPTNVTIRRNTVREMWGIGFDVFEMSGAVIEDNTAWDAQMGHFYVSNSTNVLVQRNNSYCTSGSIYLYKLHQGTSYAAADERATPVGRNVQLLNNTSTACNRSLYFWNQMAGSGLKDWTIRGNTFKGALEVGIQISAGGHENTVIADNIIRTAPTVPLIILPSSTTGLSFYHNTWSRMPPAAAHSPTDIIEN